MGTLDKTKQKLEGEWDKAKGKVKQHSDDVGTKVGGYVDEFKGKVKEKSADVADSSVNEDEED